MADPRYRAQITLARTSGLSEDVVVNVLHFEGDDDPVSPDREHWDQLAPGLASRLVTFYQAIDPYYSAVIAATGHSVRLYDMSDPEPRFPRYEQMFGLATGSTTLPSEVALCLSFQAAKVAGQSQARRRGRIYLGPFATLAMATGQLAGDNRPAANMVAEVLAAADVMATGGSGAARLAIFSPTTLVGGGSIDDAWTDAAELWIDNAWDTQRRRGANATTRSTAVV
jgi:hypothetical protein